MRGEHNGFRNLRMFTVSREFLPALVNRDFSGLTILECKALLNFLMSNPGLECLDILMEHETGDPIECPGTCDILERYGAPSKAQYVFEAHFGNYVE